MTRADAPPAALIGRDAETKELLARIDAVREGRGGALVLRGAPGIGKTALLEVARSHALAMGIQVLRTTGVQSEAQLSFAGLHHLLKPVLRDIERLPAPYGNAIRSAFGLIDEATSPQLVAMSLLQLLCDSAERTPVLVLVDDAQWLDQSTTGALAFFARRLESDPVVLIVALRDGFENPFLEAGISELAIEALTDAHAGALLDARFPTLDSGFRDRVLRDAAGNPLALVELSIALQSAAESDRELRSDLPLSMRLERAFADRLSSMAPATRRFLRVAAADGQDRVDELLTAASKIEGRPLTLEVATEAVRAGLVEIAGAELRFRHPLMRSAIKQAMSLEERQETHAALAEIFANDPDRSVWHRAAATVGKSDEVAAQLDAIARRASRRGAIGTAVEATCRAAQFAEEPQRRGGLLVKAATLAWSMGHANEVHRLLDLIEDEYVPVWHRPDLAILREAYGRGTWPETSKVLEFIEAADQVRVQGDLRQGLRLLYKIAERYNGSNPDEEPCKSLVSTLGRFPVPEDDPMLIVTLALASPVEHGAVVLDRLSPRKDDPNREYRDLPIYLGEAAFAVGDFERAERFFEPHVQFYRMHGALGGLMGALVMQAWVKLHLGDWRTAESMAGEGARMAEEVGQKSWIAFANFASATLAAYRGDTDRAARHAAAGEALLAPMRADPVRAMLQYARGATAAAAGRYDEAFQHLSAIYDPAGPAFNHSVRNWVLVDLVEAAMLSRHEGDLTLIVDELERIAVKSRSPQLGGALVYARAALSPDADGAAFRAHAELGAWPFTRARLQLAHGLWLRRQRRPADSRVPLRAARDTFDALGAAPWGERARQELRASGETSRRRTRELSDALSPQELQIAQLAATGLSNKEIGQQLFLSHRTVGFHLYRIFPKLGITTRSHLRAALQSDSDHTA